MLATEPFAATLWMAPGAVGGQQQQQRPNNPGNGNKLSKGPGKLGNGGGKSPRGGSGEFVSKLLDKNNGAGKGAKQPGSLDYKSKVFEPIKMASYFANTGTIIVTVPAAISARHALQSTLVML